MKKVTKSKGYALIYVMCVMLILTAFTLSIVSLVASNIKTTSYIRNSNRAHLAAEAGMEAAVKEFKQYVSGNYSQYFDIQHGTIEDYGIDLSEKSKRLDENNETYTYKFSFGNRTDPTTRADLRCLIITSAGSYNGVTKTITAYVDEEHISNIYQDKIFNNPITTDDNIPDITSVAADSYVLDDHISPNMITFKANGNDKQANGINNVTLQSLTQDMYNHINNDSQIKNILSSRIPYDPSDPYKYLNLDPSKPSYNEITKYMNSITDSSGDNYIKDMLAYSTFYKVLMVNGDLDVGIMKEPLINYIIYCTGKIKVSSDSNLRLWNCNIYAKDMVYTESEYKDSSNAVYYPVKYGYDRNGNIISLKYEKDKDDVPAIVNNTINIEGVSSTDAKVSILKYLMLNDDTYNQYKDNTGGTDTDAAKVFPSTAAGQFTDDDRNNVNNSFNTNLDGYAYGLKLRYIDWEEK